MFYCVTLFGDSYYMRIPSRQRHKMESYLFFYCQDLCSKFFFSLSHTSSREYPISSSMCVSFHAKAVLPWGFVGKMITQKCVLSLITNMLAIPLTILKEQSAKRENKSFFQYVCHNFYTAKSNDNLPCISLQASITWQLFSIHVAKTSHLT